MQSNVEGRLAILYGITQMGKRAPIKTMEELFLKGLMVSESRWQEMLQDILESDLVHHTDLEGETQLLISDNGMVVLSFFQDRLPLELQEKIESLTKDQGLIETNYQWEAWYEARSGFLNLLLLENQRKTFSMQIALDAEQAENILPLSLPRDGSLPAEILSLLKKEEMV